LAPFFCQLKSNGYPEYRVEIRERRSAIAERARNGTLRLPEAILEMRQAIG
jgi:hypothetical protein